MAAEKPERHAGKRVIDALADDDYYTILGVAPTATPRQIREAWIGLLARYHPDRHPTAADRFARQAARVNEAYQTLKDPARRRAYDERRRRAALQRPQRRARTPPPLSLRRVSSASGGRMRRRLPTILTGGSVVASGLVIVLLLLARPSRRPDTTVLEGPDTSRPAAVTRSSGLPNPHDQRALRPGPLSEEGEGPTRAGQPPLWSPHDVQGVVAQALPPLVPGPKAFDRKEIDTLLDEYVDAYENGDLERFMATLSSRVRERGAMDYEAIRRRYAKGFAERERIIYRIKNLHVEVEADVATVTAQYLITARNAGESPRDMTASGRIQWKIQREGDTPKVVAIDY